MVTRSKRGSGRGSSRSYVSKGNTYSKDQATTKPFDMNYYNSYNEKLRMAYAYANNKSIKKSKRDIAENNEDIKYYKKAMSDLLLGKKELRNN